jgi:hypothetical protein
MALAPRTVQNIPDRLSREPITVTELFGGLDSARISGRVRISDREAFFVPAGLREYAPQLDLPGVGWLTFRLALPAHRFFLVPLPKV